MFEGQSSQALGSDAQALVEFKGLCARARELAAQIPVRILPFSDPNIPHYSALPTDQKAKTNHALRTSLEVYQTTLNAGQSLSDSRALVWNYIKHFGLVPCSDLFNRIDQQDLVEIFDIHHFQIFRNFRFFEFCSYTIEDILCRPWVDLFIRDDADVGEKLVQVALNVSSGEVHQTIPTNIRPHTIREIQSVFCHEIEIDVKYVSPLFDKNGKIAAYMAIESARPLTRLTDEEQSRRLRAYYGEPAKAPVFEVVPDQPAF